MTDETSESAESSGSKHSESESIESVTAETDKTDGFLEGPTREEDWWLLDSAAPPTVDQLIGDAEDYGGEHNDRFVLPPKGTAIAAGLFALICLTALVIVTAAEGADGLSTVALALAVLAFIVQIIVFIYQSQTAHQQMLQSGQVYTDTRALLTEVRTAANSTEALVREQFRDLVKALMDSSKDGKGVNERLLAEALSREGAQRPLPAQEQRAVAARGQERVRTDRMRRLEAIRPLRTFPEEEEGKKVLSVMAELSGAARSRLVDLLKDEIQMYEQGSRSRLGLPIDPVDEELEARDLSHTGRIRISGDDLVVSRLTDTGRVAARLLFAIGDIPAYAAETLQQFAKAKSAEEK
jgi:hypothetical protein